MKYFYIVLATAVVYANACFADNLKTNNFKIIQEKLESADINTLIIFDVEDVLLEPRDTVLQFNHKTFVKDIERKLAEKYSNKEVDNINSSILLQRHNAPVNNDMAQIIDKAQNRGVKVMALTNCRTGKFGKISSMEEWRLQELKKHGYHFDKSWTNINDKIFSIQGEDSRDNIIFKNGVIFTSHSHTKGDALREFLKYSKIEPKSIIFIDDKEHNIKSVQDVASDMKIEFTGIEYTASKEHDTKLNEKRASLQFEVVEKEGKWLSDKEADDILAKRK